MTALLDRAPQTLRQTLDACQAAIEHEAKMIESLYRQIDRRAGIIRDLDERAAGLGDQLIRQS